MPIDMLNSGVYRLYASVRVDDGDSADSETKMVAFTNEANGCVFSINNPDHEDYALLNEKAMIIRKRK